MICTLICCTLYNKEITLRTLSGVVTHYVSLERFRTKSDPNPLRTLENMCLENSDRIRILLTH
jgi:hypothetical protein